MQQFPHMLTKQQTDFFDTFGFLCLPGLLKDKADDILANFESVFTERGGGHDGKPHDGKARSCIIQFIDHNEYLSSLLDDPRISGLASSLLGDDFNYVGSDGNYYVGDTQWHSDGWHVKYRFMKVALYLTPVTRDTGALRVIPGSHHEGDKFADMLKDIHQLDERWNITGKDVPSIALESQPGDVVCFNHNLKHSAFGGNAWRRMFTLNLCEHIPQDDIDELVGYVNQHARFWVENLYGEKMLETASPERMRHLSQPIACQSELPALARLARETMSEPSRG